MSVIEKNVLPKFEISRQFQHEMEKRGISIIASMSLSETSLNRMSTQIERLESTKLETGQSAGVLMALFDDEVTLTLSNDDFNKALDPYAFESNLHLHLNESGSIEVEARFTMHVKAKVSEKSMKVNPVHVPVSLFSTEAFSIKELLNKPAVGTTKLSKDSSASNKIAA